MNHKKIAELMKELPKVGLCPPGEIWVAELVEALGYVKPPEPVKVIPTPREGHFYFYGQVISRNFNGLRMYFEGRLRRLNGEIVDVDVVTINEYFRRGEYIDLGRDQMDALRKIADSPPN